MHVYVMMDMHCLEKSISGILKKKINLSKDTYEINILRC